MLLITLPLRLIFMSLCGQNFKKNLICFVPLDQIPNIKICHMFASEYPQVIEGRPGLIAMHVLYSEEEAEDGFIDNNGAALDEQYQSGLVEAGVRTCVTQSGTEQVEQVQQDVKSFSISSYMLKTPSLLAQGFNKNKKAQENIFNHMCNFRARSEWSNGRRYVSYYLDVDFSNDQ